MNVTGIIVEYNPFHNGHIYHINKAKEITNPDLLIAVCSGNYVQRGEPSIINKFEKTKAALKYGVDLIVELPYIFTVQNATVFGQKSVEILNYLKVNNIVFGSECNNLEELNNFANHSINIDHLKEELDKGNSYPKSYGLLAGSLYPNDILAVSYLKALKGIPIKPHSIQRTNDYHDKDLKEISSALSIRKAIKDGKDISNQCPLEINDSVFMSDMYPYLQRLLLTKSKEELKDIFLVSEGIENLLIKNAYEYGNYEDFLNNSISKRYTRSRINRICLNIMNNITKDEVKNLPPLDYIRVLGFNSKGQDYLKSIKDSDIKIVSQFKKISEPYKEIEWKVNNLYATYLNDKDSYIKEELKGPIIF